MVLFHCRNVVQRDFSIPFNYISIVRKKRPNSKTLERSDVHTITPSNDLTIEPLNDLTITRSNDQTIELFSLRTFAPSNRRTLLISVSKLPDYIRDVSNVRTCNLFPLSIVLNFSNTVYIIYCN